MCFGALQVSDSPWAEKKNSSGLELCGDSCLLAAVVGRAFFTFYFRNKTLTVPSSSSIHGGPDGWGNWLFCLLEKLQILLGKLCPTRNLVPLRGSLCSVLEEKGSLG